MLAGCTTVLENYNSAHKTFQNTTESTDPYAKTRTVVGPKQYFNRDRNSGTWYMLRQIEHSNGVNYQIVVEVLEYSWSFFHSALWPDGSTASFVKLDSRTDIGHSAYTVEQFAINISIEQLRQHISQPLRFKVYGKNNDQEVLVSNEYVKDFLNYITPN